MDSKPRRQPVTPAGGSKKQPARKCGEVMGGKTAECAAICCCCPCAVIDFLVLTAVKLPAGLWKKAMRRRKRRLRKKTGEGKKAKKNHEGGSGEGVVAASGERGGEGSCVGPCKEVGMERSPAAEVNEKEEEMWAQFYSAGFWRNPSQSERLY